MKPTKSISNETISLSPSTTHFTQTQTSIATIPLDSTQQIIDPRLKTLKQTKSICYLDATKVQHALQQQKRLKSYFNSSLKTIYILIPLHIHRQSLPSNNNSSSLIVPVTDCFAFGLKLSADQLSIDLNEKQNQIAFEQMQIASQLNEQKRELQSQEKKFALRERKFYEQTEHSKIQMQNGRKFLKEYKLKNNELITCLPNDLVEFIVKEYRHETRVHIKHILAELMGVFLEKYPCQEQQQTTPIVIDMDIETLSTQGLNDHDERFRVPTPPTNTIVVPSEPEEILIEQTSSVKDLPSIEQDHLNQSRDEFVKLLTKEACITTTNDEIEKSPTAAARTVIVVSNKNENSLIIETPNIELPKDGESKRIKIDPTTPTKTPNGSFELTTIFYEISFLCVNRNSSR